MEFGAGATTKVRLLLNECAFKAYVPVDISGDFLKAQADALRKDFPGLDVYPVAADFTAPFALPEADRRRCRRSGSSRGRRLEISSRMKPAGSCAAPATFWDKARRW